jgi:hypothetical protein
MAETPSEHGFLAKSLYVIITTPVAPHDQVMAQMAKHLARQIQLEKDGIMFGAGPLFEPGSDRPIGGMIIVRATSFAEAEAIAQADPMHASGVRSYRIQRWMLNEGSVTLTVNYSDQTMKLT